LEFYSTAGCIYFALLVFVLCLGSETSDVQFTIRINYIRLPNLFVLQKTIAGLIRSLGTGSRWFYDVHSLFGHLLVMM